MQIFIPGSPSAIELCFETKLLGYWLTVDMKPSKHVEHILKIGFGRLWTIPRLKSAGVNNDDIFHFYIMKIRSVLEYAAPVFTSMLTKQEINDIERIQKIVLKIILGECYSSYEVACSLVNTITLEERRKQLSLKFAIACLTSPQHTHFFKQRVSPYYKLRNLKSFEVPFCQTERYSSSPIPYLTGLLNKHYEERNSNK